MTFEKPVLLDVFVYGTLKRGQRNHERFCRGVLAVSESSVSLVHARVLLSRRLGPPQPEYVAQSQPDRSKHQAPIVL